MTQAVPLSVVVMTRNEAPNIRACLASLTQFREVFVVDSLSTDGTPELAVATGARVVSFRWNGEYPKKKQWCLENLPFFGEWVFFVDADERPSDALVKEISELLRRGSVFDGYFVEGRPVFLGRPLRYGWGHRKLAILRRGRARFEPCPDLGVTVMGEVEGHYQPRLEGPAGRLKAPLWHDDRKPLYAWFDRHNRYSDWEAVLAEAGNAAARWSAETRWRCRAKWLFARLPLRPLAVFFYGYVARLGFLDGAPGLHWALARAFYYWQIDVKRCAMRATAQASSEPLSRSPPSALISSKARRRTVESEMR